jgi:hypothetical protein
MDDEDLLLADERRQQLRVQNGDGYFYQDGIAPPENVDFPLPGKLYIHI